MQKVNAHDLFREWQLTDMHSSPNIITCRKIKTVMLKWKIIHVGVCATNVTSPIYHQPPVRPQRLGLWPEVAPNRASVPPRHAHWLASRRALAPGLVAALASLDGSAVVHSGMRRLDSRQPSQSCR